jgi:hypothetical protein
MKELGAAELRRSLGKVARQLKEGGEPIILKLGDERVGVLISMRDFNQRFALERAADERQVLLNEILSDARPGSVSVDEALQQLRSR